MREPGKQQHGFTLIEALVALLVLSIGMLGIAALYVETLRAGRTALLRTTAVNLAADMADRIRANRAGGLAYEGAAGVLCNPAIAAAAPPDQALNEVACWQDTVGANLPNGAGAIDVDDSTTPTTYTITVNWGEVGQAVAATYEMRLQT